MKLFKFIKVKNKNGTTERNPPSGFESWLDFWEKSNKDVKTKCMSCGKLCDDLVGGHVFKVDKTSKEYIIPLCKECNNVNNENEFEVDEDYLVPVHP